MREGIKVSTAGTSGPTTSVSYDGLENGGPLDASQFDPLSQDPLNPQYVEIIPSTNHNGVLSQQEIDMALTDNEKKRLVLEAEMARLQGVEALREEQQKMMEELMMLENQKLEIEI